MNWQIDAKIVAHKNQISENNELIAKLSRENTTLFSSLMGMMSKLTPETKERYDNELASDIWKNTEYHKRKNVRDFHSTKKHL